MNANILPTFVPNTSSIPPYPLKAFHLISLEAAEEIHRIVQAPDALVGMSIISAMSAAAQGLIDIRLPTGQVRPVSCNLMTIAESGERKSPVESLVCKPIYDFDELRAKKYESDLTHYHIELRFWKAVDSGIRRQITRLVQKGGAVDELHDQLLDNATKMPVKPRLRRLIRQILSEKAIMEAIQGNGESIVLMTDEGEVILKGGAMNHTGLLNKGWDGANLLSFDRGDHESIIARKPRMMISVMVQQTILKEFLDRHGNVARGSGHWARYLVGWPASTQGMRFMFYEEAVWTHLPVFHARVTELLEEYARIVAAGEVERTIIEFSDEAKKRWIDMVNNVEQMLKPCGYLSDIKDFASKSMEIVGRMAGLFHCFSKQEGKISVDTLERALAIVKWHMDEFKRIFSPQCSVPEVQVNAQALERYLQSQYASINFTVAPKNDVQKRWPDTTEPEV